MPRNVVDDVLELVGRTGGVVMVTCVPWFLTPEGAEATAAEWAEVARLRAQRPGDPEAVRAGAEAWDASQPPPKATVGDMADHVDHIRDVAGIDALGIGSDFDGTTAVPDGLEDVSKYPAMFEELAARGYTDEELAKIAGRNVLQAAHTPPGSAPGLVCTAYDAYWVDSPTTPRP